MSLPASKVEGHSKVFPHDHPACSGRNVGSAIPTSNLSKPKSSPMGGSPGGFKVRVHMAPSHLTFYVLIPLSSPHLPVPCSPPQGIGEGWSVLLPRVDHSPPPYVGLFKSSLEQTLKVAQI